jgi:CrcB protein
MTFAHFRAPMAVGLGAVAGALSRFYLGPWLTNLTGITTFPVGTLGVNLCGCFLMGGFIAITAKTDRISPDLRLLIATGFLGSLTTFSSYELDTSDLLDLKGWRQDMLYGLGSPLLGLACLYGGLAVAGARGKNRE